MSNSKKVLLQQTINDAERQGEAFADAVRDLISEDEIKFLKFIDAFYYFYDLMGNRQFIDFHILLGDVFGISTLPEIEAYRSDDEKADAYISHFMEAFFYAALSVISNAN